MPKNPWRCSQCGTVNEPAATTCWSCGRWPSLFDLQDSAFGETETEQRAPATPVRSSLEAPRPVLVGEGPYESFPEAIESYEPEDEVDEEGESPARPTSTRARTRRIVRLLVPLGVVLYLLISSYFSNH